jgi:hypothetical protein
MVSLYMFQGKLIGLELKRSVVELLNQYLPTFRLVLKGPVYLKDKSGEMMVPLSIVSGNSSDGKMQVFMNGSSHCGFILINSSPNRQRVYDQLFIRY